MKEWRVHHYGLATADLERSMETMRTLGYHVGTITYDAIQKVRVAFVSRDQEAMIELVCDADENGPTKRFVSQVGNGFYHICYEVDSIEEATKKLREEGFLLRHAPVPAVACGGKKIAWMYNRYIGLIELVEK
ncbi:MAG TPA: VOC family protein [bacterium]|nr:VOC family protein [bacterium]